MCQKCVKIHKCEKKLTKNCQKPKCLQNLSKILLKYGKNMSKFKNVFKICQTQFHKSDKNLAKQRVLTPFCHIYAPVWKHFEETFVTKLWQNCDKTCFFDIFLSHFIFSTETFMTFPSKIVTKICQNPEFWQPKYSLCKRQD